MVCSLSKEQTRSEVHKLQKIQTDMNYNGQHDPSLSRPLKSKEKNLARPLQGKDQTKSEIHKTERIQDTFYANDNQQTRCHTPQ